MADDKIFEYHPASVVPIFLSEDEPPVAIDVLYTILTSSKFNSYSTVSFYTERNEEK